MMNKQQDSAGEMKFALPINLSSGPVGATKNKHPEVKESFLVLSARRQLDLVYFRLLKLFESDGGTFFSTFTHKVRIADTPHRPNFSQTN